jgi:hypothetical protein
MWNLPQATTALRVSCEDGPAGKPSALIRFRLIFDFSGGLAVYSYIPQASNFAV